VPGCARARDRQGPAIIRLRFGRRSAQPENCCRQHSPDLERRTDVTSPGQLGGNANITARPQGGRPAGVPDRHGNSVRDHTGLCFAVRCSMALGRASASGSRPFPETGIDEKKRSLFAQTRAPQEAVQAKPAQRTDNTLVPSLDQHWDCREKTPGPGISFDRLGPWNNPPPPAPAVMNDGRHGQQGDANQRDLRR